jgi:hypothetical protein
MEEKTEMVSNIGIIHVLKGLEEYKMTESDRIKFYILLLCYSYTSYRHFQTGEPDLPTQI